MAQYQYNNIPRHILGNSNILPQMKANQSMFNLSEDLKTTIGFDYLYPVYWESMLPGDRFDVSVKSLARLMPMVAPVMSNIRLKYFAFFVPNRLLWQNWTRFMGERIYQEEVKDYTEPVVQASRANSGIGSIADYLGFPSGNLVADNTGVNISALPFRAYNKIYNEWFRANELQPLIPQISTDNGDFDGLYAYDPNVPDTGIYGLHKKGKPLDYFTSCLPYPQSGDPVTVPLTGNAAVLTNKEATILNAYNESDGTSVPIQIGMTNGSGNATTRRTGQPVEHNYTGLYADMSAVTGVSIEMLRKASALQVLLEKDARAGETYVDLMKVHFAVDVPDFLVGRSQFLGSSTTSINVEPIANVSSTTEVSPQGNLAGLGIGVNGDKLCEISAVEHGIFMIIACADSELSYSQGLPRKFSRQTRYDYMFPEFHNLGDQAVLNKELFLSGDTNQDEQVFGYQERYRELREGINKVSGLMRHGTNSLDVWHLGQKFNNLPTLGSDFIQCNTPIDRVMAVPTEDQIILNTFFDIKAIRTLPVTSNPSILAGRV